MTSVRIAGTGAALPSRRVSTEELARVLHPGEDPSVWVRRTGIVERRWLGPGEDAGSLAATAVRGALEAAGVRPEELGRLVLTTQTGGDTRSPATANRVLAALDIDDTCDAFDLNGACTGFLHALDVAALTVAATGMPVAVVAVETFSRDLSVKAPRAMLVFGDGAAAAVLVPDSEGAGFVGRWLRNDARLRGQVEWPLGPPLADGPAAPAALPTTGPPWHHFAVPAAALAGVAVKAVGRAAAEVMAQAGVSVAQLDHFLPHQPNGLLYEALFAEVGAQLSQGVRLVDRVGSVGAASVALSLDAAFRASPPRPGGWSLLASVGAGTSYGALLYRAPGGPR